MLTIELAFEKPTKSKVRFQHPDFGTVYVPNEQYLTLGSPDRIRLTLEAAPALQAVQAA